MSIRFSRPVVAFLIALLLGAGTIAAWEFKGTHKQAILQSPIAQRFIPLYRSLRKLPDLVFMPWAAFASSHLETYELTISPQNIERMNAVLPEQPFNSGMIEGSKLWVKGYFRTADYEGPVDVRYRGNLAAHWNAYQKSYAIEFPKDHLFRGMRELNLVIPSKRRYLGMSLNDYRAEKLGLLHPDESLIWLKFNGADTGVMLSFESWSQPWIEKMPISSLSTLYGVDEGTAPYEQRWDSWNATDPVDFAPLKALQELVEYAPDDVFAALIPQLIDIEDWYNWDVMRILASGYHVSADTSFGANNLVLVFDRAEGRFKPVPYNTVIYTDDYRSKASLEGVRGEPTRLYKRILSIPEFRARRDEVWEEYRQTEKEDDLRFLADWQHTYNREFLLDTAKNDNNFMYLQKITEYVTAAKEYFDDPFGIVATTYNVDITPKTTLDLPEGFTELARTGMTPAEAATQHPALRVTAAGLHIAAGTYRFADTIIIPARTTLTIDPGATLLFANNASLISYSPVIANGTEAKPIVITGTTADTKWGVFAVINALGTSTLAHVHASGGGEVTMNGAYISGTLAFHNSDVVLTDSVVSEARGDDGLNVKGARAVLERNLFTHNSSDGVDLDYPDPTSVIAHNQFIENYGDSLDLSWSEITINDNEIIGCADKGISVGERSRPTIIDTRISECQMGVAVKDGSVATLRGNTISHNHTAIAAYQKKEFFTGGTVYLSGNIVADNEQLEFKDELSVINWE